MLELVVLVFHGSLVEPKESLCLRSGVMPGFMVVLEAILGFNVNLKGAEALYEPMLDRGILGIIDEEVRDRRFSIDMSAEKGISATDD